MQRARFSHEAYRIDRWGRKHSLRRWTPGDASEFIHYLPDRIQRDPSPVVLYCRESTPDQERAGNLTDQMFQAIRELRHLGIKLRRKLIGVYDCVETSKIRSDRPVLEQAIRCAQKHNAILVAPSRDRFIRSSSFRYGKMKAEFPTDYEYQELVRLAGDVRLATILEPDDGAVRSQQIIRGQTCKGRKGGPPLKTEQRGLMEACWSMFKTLPDYRGVRVS